MDELFEIFMDDGNIERREPPRLITGLYSFDNAMGGIQGKIGLAMRSLVMVYGREHTGKSTLAWSLMARACKDLNSNMALLNFENMDRRFFANVVRSQGFAPPLKVREIRYTFSEEHNCETALKSLTNTLADDDFSCCLLDSAGAVAVASEVEGSYGERNIGGRAFVLNQFTRETARLFGSDINGLMFVTNHVQPNIGFVGHNIPGGTGLKFFSHYHWMLKYDEREDGNYIIRGVVKKNKYGKDQTTFQVYMLYGSGIHTGLTAMQDCIDLGIATQSKTKGKAIALGGEKIDYKKNIIQKAHDGETEIFEPFFEALLKYDQEEGTGKWKINTSP